MQSDEELMHDYATNLANGKKNLLCNDFPDAVECFQAACAVQSERFGDTSPECAEAFFYYGRALLELARVENGVLGNALKGVPETEDSDSDTDEQFGKTKGIPDSEREQIRLDIEAAMATDEDDDDNNAFENENSDENISGLSKSLREATSRFLKSGDFTKPNTKASRTLFDIKEENKTNEEKDEADKNPGQVEEKSSDIDSSIKEKVCSTDQSEKDGTNEGPNSTQSDDQKPSTSEKKTNEHAEEVTEDPDDIPNMQLAWEMLELAKVLYSKKPVTEESSLMIAQCQLKLGELGLEIENYPQAIEDFLAALSIQKDVLPAHDRRIAETHYSLGLAYGFNTAYDDATKHYQEALGSLESRIDFLNERIDTNDGNTEKDGEVMEECAEVGEIRSLIPDINSKIEDVFLMKTQENRLRAAAFAQKEEPSGSSSQTASLVCTVIPVRKGDRSSSSASPAVASTDISHLVRRKRASTSEEAACSKRTKEETPAAAATPGESSEMTSSAEEEKSSPAVSGATEASPDTEKETEPPAQT